MTASGACPLQIFAFKWLQRALGGPHGGCIPQVKQAAHGNGETTNHRLLMVHVKDEFLAARGDRATSKQAGEVLGGSTTLHHDQRLLQDDPKEGKAAWRSDC